MKFKFFEALGIEGSEVPSASQDMTDGLSPAEQPESGPLHQDYENLSNGDRWQNETDDLRIECLEDGAVSVIFYASEHGTNRGTVFYENIDMLREMLRNGEYEKVVKSGLSKRTEASQINEAELEEIEKLVSEVQELVDDARARLNSQELTPEERAKRTNLVLEKENQLKTIEYLVNNGKTDKKDALDNLNGLRNWFSLFSSDKGESQKSEKEIVDAPQGATASLVPGENASSIEASPSEPEAAALAPLAAEKNATVQQRRRRKSKEEQKSQIVPERGEKNPTGEHSASEVSPESVNADVPEQSSSTPDVDTTRVANPYEERTENEGESRWRKNSRALSREIAQAVGNGESSQEPESSQESIPADKTENQDIEEEITFPTREGETIDFVDEDGKRIRYVYRESEGLVNIDPNHNEVAAITAEELRSRLASKKLSVYSDALAEQLTKEALAGEGDAAEDVNELHEDSPQAEEIERAFKQSPQVSPEERAAARAALGLNPEPTQEAEREAQIAQAETKEGTEKGEETLQQKIERLKSEVAEMRAEYVKEDYKNTNAWAKVKSFFRLKDSGKSADMEYWQEQYQNKLIAVQEAELENLKQSGLTGNDLKEAMAGTLQYFKLDEVISLVDARTRYRAENRGWGEKVVDTFGAMGRYYNRLSLKEKLALTAILAGGTIVTVGSGGVAGSAIAAMLVGARKVFSGSGTFVGVEALLEEHGKRSLAKKAKRETDTQMNMLAIEGLGVSPEADFENLSMLLKNDIDALDGKLQDEKRAKLYRKAGAAVAGYAVGSGWLSQVIMEHVGGNEAAQWVKDQIAHHVTPGPTPQVVPVMSTETAATATRSMSVPTIGDTTSVPAAVVASEMPLSRETSELLKEHVVTSADGKRGLWGVIESRLPADMSVADKPRAIALLEQEIAEKLKTMSPEELQAAGFRKGDIGKIFVGDTIRFDKVLSAEEIQSVLSERITQPDIAPVVDGSMDRTINPIQPTAIEPETVDAQDLELEGDTLTEKPGNPDVLKAAGNELPVKRVSDVREFLAQYPGEMPALKKEVLNFRMGIFATSEVANMENYNYVFHGQELANAKVIQVLADYHRHIVPNNPLNPLHPSQMEHVNNFVKAAAKNFGSVGYAKANETIEAYTRRIAMLSLQRKIEENPDFVFKF